MQRCSVPCGNALAATALLRLGKLTGRTDYLDAARRTLAAAASLMEKLPMATGQMLLALDLLIGPTPEIVLLGDLDSPDMKTVLADLHRRYIPNKVAARGADPLPVPASSGLSGLFAGKPALSPPPTLYICENFACQSAVSGTVAIAEKLDDLSGLQNRVQL